MNQQKKSFPVKVILLVALGLCVLLVNYIYINNKVNDLETKVIEIEKQSEEHKDTTQNLNDELYTNTKTTEDIERRIKSVEDEISRGSARSFDVTVTAYDLSVQSCGKYPGSPGYGVTASGINLAGHTLESARAIAVDPSVIPLGSKVKINFYDDSMKKYNGVYRAVDTGGAISGRKIDLFFGDTGNYTSDAVWEFGVRKAKISIL